MNTGKRRAVHLLLLIPFFLLSSVLAQNTAPAKSADEARLPLHDGWSLQTSAKVEAQGEVISTAQFSPQGWHEVTVPTTVVAALVKDKTLPDPLSGMNLRDLPGVTYPIGGNFSNIAMAPDSPYAVSWWYRKQFAVPASYKGKTRLVEVQRHQLSRQHFSERKTDREVGRRRRRLAHLRIQRDRGRQTGRGECSRSPGLFSHGARSGHHLRRLESRASRQKHGTVARSLSHHERPGGAALSHSRIETESTSKRQRAAHRDRTSEERHEPARQGQTQRADRERSSSSRMWNWRRTKRRTSHSLPTSFSSSSSRTRGCGGPRKWASRIFIR